ncbi:MAG: leucine-rich repeat protein, partial [Lachnospiraceae bacterium]|nr:leucine-rich repeat protein [Lachnospiraceae bacterium]
MRRKISRILAGMLAAIVVMSSLDMTTLASERLPETSIQEETGTEDVVLSGSEETEDDSSELISEEVSETSESASETESEESSETTSEIGSEEVSETTSEIGSEEASESTSETGSEEASETTSESDSEEDSEGSKEESELSEENTEQVLSEEENLSNESDGVYTIEGTQDEYVWVYSNKDHKLTISVNPNFPGNSAGILNYSVYSEINDQIRAKVSGFDNNSIEIVRYGEGIKYIESYYYSTAIKEIILSDSVEKYSNDGYSSNFLYQNGLTVTFEARTSMPITTTVSWETEGFPYAKRIVFPEGITEIPRSWQLWSVEEIYLSSTITKLDRSFLASCYELTKITVAENSPFFRVMDGVVYHINTNSTYELFFFNDDLVTDDGVFTLPKEVSGINVWNNPGEITEFALEEGNRYLRIIDGAIYNFEVTKLLLVPAGKTGKFVLENGCYISNFALLNCSGITEVDFSAGVVDYWNGEGIDFSYLNTCTSLEKVVFPYYGYFYIDWDDFSTFEYLKEVDFGCARSIYDSCHDCPSLEQIRLSSTYCIAGSFVGCDALESVTIPKSVEEIDVSFNDCSNLKAVYFENSDIQLWNPYGDHSVASFQNCSEELTFY